MSHSTSPSKKLTRPGILSWLGVAVLAAAILAAPGSAKAESDPAGIDGTEEVVVSVERPDYHYEAPKGSNLTYMVRRSLQNEDPTDAPYTAAQVATETCIVQALGARDLIFVGEQIVVEGQVMADCIEQADQLTPEQLECWARYLPVRENLDWIQPTEIVWPAGVGAEAPGDLPEFGEITDEASQIGAGGSTDNDGSSFSSWYWWLIAGFIFVLGWYFMVLGRTWRAGTDLPVDTSDDDTKVSQTEADSTPVKADDSSSKESTNKKSKPRKRRSNKSS